MFKHHLESEPLIKVNGVWQFSGFPYLMTYIVCSFYHFVLLPSTLSREALFDMAKLQAQKNRLDTFLLLGAGDIIYFPVDGEYQSISRPPDCSIYIADRLQPAFEITEDGDLKRREARLNALIEEVKSPGGYVVGDSTKGGRRPAAEELGQLAGFQEKGVPKGLVRCPNCGFYRGTCLDQKGPGHKRGLLVKVYCLCESDNLCARCSKPLYKFKLNANYFDEEDKTIWYVPGFCGLGHKCPDMQRE